MGIISMIDMMKRGKRDLQHLGNDIQHQDFNMMKRGKRDLQHLGNDIQHQHFNMMTRGKRDLGNDIQHQHFKLNKWHSKCKMALQMQ